MLSINLESFVNCNSLYRITIGRDLERSSSPTLLPKQLRAGCTGTCPDGF